MSKKACSKGGTKGQENFLWNNRWVCISEIVNSRQLFKTGLRTYVVGFLKMNEF